MSKTLTPLDAATILLNACQEIGEQIYFDEDIFVQTLRGSDTHPVRFFNLKRLRCFETFADVKAKPLLDAIAWLIKEEFIYRADEGAQTLLLLAPNALERIKTADLMDFAKLLQLDKE